MEKSLDLSHSVFQLVTAHPGLADILVTLGFPDIVKPGMLQTAGRIMTLEKGARMKGIPLETIRATLEQHGYTIVPARCDGQAREGGTR